MDNGLDHPDVVHALETGYPRPFRKERRWCPACERTLYAHNTVYTNYKEVVGCEFCMGEMTADEAWG